MRDTKHASPMAAALAEAANGIAKGHGGPFGAVIVKDGDIVARAHTTVVADTDPSAHAEVNAIRAACKKLATPHLDGCVLVASSEPCPMCMAAAYWARVDEIVFCLPRAVAADAGFSDIFIRDELALPPETRRIPLRQDDTASEAARSLFSSWQRENGKLY